MDAPRALTSLRIRVALMLDAISTCPKEPPMATCPFAKQLLIPPGSNDPRITARAAILHVDAGNAESLYTFFRDRSGGIESHFFVKKDGSIEQYRDTAFQADANLDANDFAISIETQGFGAGEWTPAQLAAIKRLLVWCSETHKFPLQKIPTATGAGVGYHTQFGAPGPWTPVSKTCPGPDRIRQFEKVLVPWMAEVTHPKPAVKPKSRGPRVDAAIEQLRDARDKTKPGKRRHAIRDAIKSLVGITPR